MSEASLERSKSPLELVSNAMVHLHKEQFGRGPTKARSYFAGPDLLVCVLEDVLLPAERKQVEMGQQQRVVEARTSFQADTKQDFIIAIERIMERKVIAFASTVDADSNVVFENFSFEAIQARTDALGEIGIEGTSAASTQEAENG
jgi:uncharacterized protein YbcI